MPLQPEKKKDLAQPDEEKQKDAGQNANRSMLDSALYNFNIAKQHTDETAYLAEHRLINFHYGVALLARYRNVPEKLTVAHQCFTDAANRKLKPNSEIKYEIAYLRIVSEAYYNLGVIEELQAHFDGKIHHCQQAIDFYERAVNEDDKVYPREEKLRPNLCIRSCQIHLLGKQPSRGLRPPKGRRQRQRRQRQRRRRP
jgi:hypothetical protein